MTFRLINFEIDDYTFRTNKVQLVDHKKDTLNNYFSLIVGNNGTGKSQFLRSIVNALRGNHKYKYNDLFVFSSFEQIGEPSKIIAVTNSLTDKFPLGRQPNNSNSFNYKGELYNYLGTRGRFGASPKYLMNRAIDILIENYSNKDVSKCLRHVFDYLDYKPIIELTYTSALREKRQHFLLKKEKIEPSDIIDYLDYGYINIKNSKYGMAKEPEEDDYFQILKKKYIDRFQEICDFLNDNELLLYKAEYNIFIDFSDSNIKQLNKDISSYKKNVRIYEILDFLRKIHIISSVSVKVFKSKEDAFFNFNDTSSGEANILTTMISLIPLLKDNCCVVIDEPEISLHPSWQYRYIELLMKVFESFKGCHIIIASHSHFLVSDLPIEGSSVITLKKEGQNVKAELLPDSTYGWSAEDILLNIFDMPTSRNYYLSNIISEALELIANNRKHTKQFHEIKKKLASFELNMKDYDPLKLVIKTIISIDNESKNN